MTSHLVHAFDRRRAHAVPPSPRAIRPPHAVLSRRALPIRAALEWAFGVEHASLDFAEGQGDNARPGVSPLWTVMQRGALGCTIDGGGYSLPARDADIIASAVANLPASLGGKGMAVQLAELARAGSAPDWGQDLRQRCQPKAWRRETRHGRDAEVELIETVQVQGRGGRLVQWPVYACPVTYTATAERISAARRAYLSWIEALAWLAVDLRAKPVLDRITITDMLPVMEPWAGQSGALRVA